MSKIRSTITLIYIVSTELSQKLKSIKKVKSAILIIVIQLCPRFRLFHEKVDPWVGGKRNMSFVFCCIVKITMSIHTFSTKKSHETKDGFKKTRENFRTPKKNSGKKNTIAISKFCKIFGSEEEMTEIPWSYE